MRCPSDWDDQKGSTVADRVSALLFCPTDTAVRNLGSAGITDGVHQVGDAMYDSVLFNAELAEESSDVNLREKGKSRA